MATHADTAQLIHELILHRYRMSDGVAQAHVEELDIPGYLALHRIADTAANKDDPNGRTYLQDLADNMQVAVRQVSKLAESLRDRGLVQWAHDGNGDEGTYVVITDAGRRLMTGKEQALKDYYSRVVEAYGRDELRQLLGMMQRLETVMNAAWNETEVK